MAIEVYDAEDMAASNFARCLVTGDPKAGKTTLCGTTCPGPILFLNCDKPGAPMAAKRHGGKFKVIDIGSAGEWRQAVAYAVAESAKGNFNSIIVDTVTVLINNAIALEMKKRFDGFDIWREVQAAAMQPLNDLLEAQAHVFLLAHYEPKNGQIALDGGLKTTIPALVHDRVHLEYNPKNNPPRVLHIGPSASGLSGGRNSDESKTIKADIRVLLSELGYDLDGGGAPA